MHVLENCAFLVFTVGFYSRIYHSSLSLDIIIVVIIFIAIIVIV